MSHGHINTDAELSGPRPRAWCCPVRNHDEIRISHQAEDDPPRCLHPHADHVCDLKMVSIDLIGLARRTIGKYGADATKPSVLLACGLIDGAHERDALRQKLASVQAIDDITIKTLVEGQNAATKKIHELLEEYRSLHQQLEEARALVKQVRDADEDNRRLVEQLGEACRIARKWIDSDDDLRRIGEIEREGGLS